MTVKYNVSSSSGNANGLTTSSVVGGTAVFIGNVNQKLKYISALVTCLADTSTFTWAFKWQVSNDNSTWVDVSNGSQNAAAVVLATGTGGADTAVTKSIPAPDAVNGWQWVRAALVTGGTTGATIDTYAIGYCYRQGS